MVSWKNPLPLGEYTSNRVVVYSYDGRWIPIMSYRLADAIALYHKVREKEKEIWVFPPDVDPNQFQSELKGALSCQIHYNQTRPFSFNSKEYLLESRGSEAQVMNSSK